LLFYLCFSRVKKELKSIDEMRFIFTSPTFTTEKQPKKKFELVQKIKILKKQLDVL